MVTTILIVTLIITALVSWITIYVTNKAYSRKWDQEEPKPIEPEDKNEP